MTELAGFVSVSVPVARRALRAELARMEQRIKDDDDKFYTWFAERQNKAIMARFVRASRSWWRRLLRRPVMLSAVVTRETAPDEFRKWHAHPDHWRYMLEQEMPNGVGWPGVGNGWRKEVAKLLRIAERTHDDATMLLSMEDCETLVLQKVATNEQQDPQAPVGEAPGPAPCDH